jgi:transcriptional regulator with XRE-family HTH domain
MSESRKRQALASLRQERGLSQAALARKSGLNQSTVNQIETGRLVPYESQLRKLASALGVPEDRASDLLAGDDRAAAEGK